VRHVPTAVGSLYDEARGCITGNYHTAAILLCRKILMHIAVEKGAKEGLRFIEYIDHLANSGYVPPNGKPWVDHIRQKGNEANHELVIMAREDATLLLTFLEMLLRFIYEFPNSIPKTPSLPRRPPGNGPPKKNASTAILERNVRRPQARKCRNQENALKSWERDCWR
jgi:hypothetical protein